MSLTKKEKTLLAQAIVNLENAEKDVDGGLYWVGIAKWEITQVLHPGVEYDPRSTESRPRDSTLSRRLRAIEGAISWAQEDAVLIAHGKESDGGDDVELSIEKLDNPKARPWVLRAEGVYQSGVVGHSRTLREAKELAALYLDRGLSTEDE